MSFVEGLPRTGRIPLLAGGSLARVLNASTGSGQRYCVDGDCDVAVTRPGQLHHPVYFDGGIAIHGSPDPSPTQPAD